MRKKSIKNLVCIATMSIMLFSTLGMGVFAADQTGESSNGEGTTAEQDQQAGGDVQDEITEEPSVDQNIDEETPTDEDAAKLDEEPLKDVDPADLTLSKGVEGIKTLAGHRRIEIQWNAITDETAVPKASEEPSEGISTDEGGTETDVQEPIPVKITKYVILRKQANLAALNSSYDYEPYAEIQVNEDGTIAEYSGNAFDPNWSISEDHDLYTTNKYLKYSKWDKSKFEGNNKAIDFKDGKYYFQDGDVGDGMVDAYSKKTRGGVFYYKVIPYGVVTDGNGPDEEISYDEAKAKFAKEQCVRTSYVRLRVKAKVSLKSHIGEKESSSYKKNRYNHTFKTSDLIYTTGYGVGQYVIIYKDQVYYMNRIRAKSQKSLYTYNNPYTEEESEYFVNHQQTSSSGYGRGEAKGKYLIWVNTYTQRVYIFQGKTSHWERIYCWKVSTGKAKSPTIRHLDPKNDQLSSGRKIGMYADIWKKLSSRHGIRYWNCFSSYNAMHGQRSGWSFGRPHSGGCVRNTTSHAKWIYNHCSSGKDRTRVIVF